MVRVYFSKFWGGWQAKCTIYLIYITCFKAIQNNLGLEISPIKATETDFLLAERIDGIFVFIFCIRPLKTVEI